MNDTLLLVYHIHPNTQTNPLYLSKYIHIIPFKFKQTNMKKNISTLAALLASVMISQAQNANQNLSNLVAPTSINKDLLPAVHGTYNLGEPPRAWKNISLTGLIFLRNEPFIKAPGTGSTYLGIAAGKETDVSGSSYNTGVGFNSMFKIFDGKYNTATGYQSLYSIFGGNNNTAYGAQALFSNTAGVGNTATGYQALYSNTANNNLANGYQALYSNTTGAGNSAFGYQALYANKTGNNSVAIGYRSLAADTSGLNTAVGALTLSANKEGTENSAFGLASLNSNTTGNWNSAFGSSTLNFNTTGEGNTAFGVDALKKNTTGGANIAVGMGALMQNETGANNVVIGGSALASSRYSSDNTVVGSRALIVFQEGNYNTALGSNAGNIGYSNVNSCTFLGAMTSTPFGGQYNTTVIGYNAQAAADNQVVIGNTNVTSIGGYANWTNFSDGRYKKNVKEDVPGLSFIKELRPVTYTLDIAGVNKTNQPGGKSQELINGRHAKLLSNKNSDGTDAALAEKATGEKSKIVYTGFVAQEVESAAKKLNYDFSGVKKPANDKDYYGLRYAEFVVPLVKAVQELSSANDEIKAENATLKATNEKLEARLAAIEQLLKTNNLGTISLDKNTLGQNIPNPANGRMTIPFSLSSETQHASIVITELGSGKVLKTIPVTAAQKSVSVELGNIASGTYVYSLVINNRTSDSKKMLIAK